LLTKYSADEVIAILKQEQAAVLLLLCRGASKRSS